MKKPATKIIEKQIKNTQTIAEKNWNRNRKNNTEQSRENNAEIKYEALAINENTERDRETEREGKKLKIIIIIICKSEQRRAAPQSPQYMRGWCALARALTTTGQGMAHWASRAGLTDWLTDRQRTE